MFLAFGKVKTLQKCRLNASANKARKPQNRLRIKGDGLKQRTQIVRTEIQANKPLGIKCLFSFLCIFVERHFIGEFSFFRQEQNVLVFFFIFSFSRSHNQCYSYVSVCEIGSLTVSKQYILLVIKYKPCVSDFYESNSTRNKKHKLT